MKQTLSSNSKLKNSQNLETPKIFVPYEKGISEQLKRVTNKHGSGVIFTRFLSLSSKLRTNPFKSHVESCACGVDIQGNLTGVVYKVT